MKTITLIKRNGQRLKTTAKSPRGVIAQISAAKFSMNAQECSEQFNLGWFMEQDGELIGVVKGAGWMAMGRGINAA